MMLLPRLIERARRRETIRRSLITESLSLVDLDELVAEYYEMMAAAPRRGADGYKYFIDRRTPPQSEDERRGEERLAMALARGHAVIRAGGEDLEVLMYAFPLYSSGGPRGLRAVDMVGYAARPKRFWVGELKTKPPETPLRALLEALVYAAVVEANHEHIAQEMVEHGWPTGSPRPGLLIAAPTRYWEAWTPTPRIGDWWGPYKALTASLADRLETPIGTVDLGPVSQQTGADKWPHLDGEIICQAVEY